MKTIEAFVVLGIICSLLFMVGIAPTIIALWKEYGHNFKRLRKLPSK